MLIGRLWLHRSPQYLCIGDRRSGYGLTIHRHAGISLIGVPREGGTSILWARAGQKVRHQAWDLRYRRDLGCVIVVAGAYFG